MGRRAGAGAGGVQFVIDHHRRGAGQRVGGGRVGVAKPSGTLVVFAATSLTDAFNMIGAQFQQAHPGVSVKFNYNGSSSLATQITQGAPADVFASAARPT